MTLEKALELALAELESAYLNEREYHDRCETRVDALNQAMEQIGKLKTFLYSTYQDRALEAGAAFAQKDRARQIRQWLSEEGANGTPPEYPWFGCKTDKDLLDAVDAEMKLGGKTQIEALEVMLHA